MASQHSGGDTTYRIVSKNYPPFDGTGTHRWGSRWIGPGRWVVHTAETYALAILENLVHWQRSSLPPTLVRVEARVPDSLEQEELPYSAMPKGRPDDYAAFREIGDDWYDRGETAVLWVPSVVSPVERNVLFNQTHEDFKRIRVGKPLPAHIDPRLL